MLSLLSASLGCFAAGSQQPVSEKSPPPKSVKVGFFEGLGENFLSIFGFKGGLIIGLVLSSQKVFVGNYWISSYSSHHLFWVSCLALNWKEAENFLGIRSHNIYIVLIICFIFFAFLKEAPLFGSFDDFFQKGFWANPIKLLANWSPGEKKLMFSGFFLCFHRFFYVFTGFSAGFRRFSPFLCRFSPVFPPVFVRLDEGRVASHGVAMAGDRNGSLQSGMWGEGRGRRLFFSFFCYFFLCVLIFFFSGVLAAVFWMVFVWFGKPLVFQLWMALGYWSLNVGLWKAWVLPLPKPGFRWFFIFAIVKGLWGNLFWLVF